jgi:hypothetical protein
MTTEFDKFVDALPGSEEQGFNINRELNGDSQPDQAPEGQKPAEGQQTPVTPTTDDVPFNENPKIQKFIKRQVAKGIQEALQSAPQPQRVDTIDNKTNSEVPAEWIAMYGDNEDSRKAWGFQSKLLNDYKNQATEDALIKFRSEQERGQAEVRQFEQTITTEVENIEDVYGVDLTSNTAEAKKARSEYLDLVQRLSPKDADGNITSYADFDQVWQIYKNSQVAQPTPTRQKDLASRSVNTPTSETPNQQGYQQGMGFDGIRQMLGGQ